MIHKIEVEVDAPEGWVPVGFGHVRLGESFLNPDTTVEKWSAPTKSNGLYLKVKRVKWKPADGEKVWTFSPFVGVTSVYFMEIPALAQAYENNLLFETEAEAREAYSATLKLMETMGETK